MDMLAVWCISQEAVHFELIDYSQKQQKEKPIRKTQIHHYYEISNVTMEFTNGKDMTTIIKINGFWFKKKKTAWDLRQSAPAVH